MLTKQVLEKTLVNKHLKVILYIAEQVKKIGKYPQTKVNNPEGISHFKDEERELKFNSKAKDYTLKFTRSFWKDSAGNKYEKYNGEYFKFEDVEFVKIPNKKTWFTKHIIDFAFYNFYYFDYPDNTKPERSVYSSFVKDIEKFLGVDTFYVTFDDGDFGIKSALDANNSNPKFIKTSTDYARAVHGGKDGHVAEYRGIDFLSFLKRDIQLPHYRFSSISGWWLGTSYRANQAYSINGSGNLEEDYYMHVVFGVVVCIR